MGLGLMETLGSIVSIVHKTEVLRSKVVNLVEL